MTTGLITTGVLNGASATDSYFEKSWNGADGKTTENAYSGTITRVKRTKSKLVPYPGSPATYHCDCSAFGQGILSWSANDELALQGKLIEKIRGHNFNLAVSAAEGREAVSLLVNAAGSLSKSVRNLRKGDVGGALRALGRSPSGVVKHRKPLNDKDISSTWLSIQYGWVPLLSDVFESFKAYEALTASARINTIRVRHTVDKKYNSSTSPGNWSCQGNSKYSKTLKAVLRENISTARSLGLTNPAAVVWEKIPFSFVADWFIPIGDYVEALDVIPKLNATITRSSKLSNTGSNPSLTAAGKLMYSDVGFNHYRTDIVSTREANVSLVVPTPNFNSVSDAISGKRMWNALALIHQVFMK